MLGRWITRRCLTDDAPSLGNARNGIAKHLREQDPKSSGAEHWQAADRVDASTYHYGTGRGVRWLDKDRTILWLCALCHEHNGGYKYAEDLQTGAALYPDVDPDPDAADGSLAAWGDYPDEDSLEWARIIYGALCAFDEGAETVEGGGVVIYDNRAYLRLIRDADGIWTLTIRWTLGYQHPANRRYRRISFDEVTALFDHLAGWPDETKRRGIAWDNPPNPQHWTFVDVHFIEPLLTAKEWLDQIAIKHLAGETVPLVGETT